MSIHMPWCAHEHVAILLYDFYYYYYYIGSIYYYYQIDANLLCFADQIRSGGTLLNSSHLSLAPLWRDLSILSLIHI